MPERSSRGAGGGGYVFGFVGTAALLIGATLVLVLYVLPERYVLSSGFREGNLNLPDPATPFQPAPPLRIAAIPALSGDEAPVRGPSELFWERVLPLLDAGRFEEALPLFTDYLAEYPGDPGVRREYGITLAATGDADRAIPVLEELLAAEDDDELHLLLARVLRDEGHIRDAGEHYALLVQRHPDDTALAVEWSRALSWIEDYGRAEEVLLAALEREPGSVPLRAELVRVHSYRGRAEEARRILDELTEEDIEAEGLGDLREDVIAWLTPPPDTTVVVPPPPPTLLEQAAFAREDDDFERADSLFLAALSESPSDVEAWQAYADFLQYEMEDLEAALGALAEVERLAAEEDVARQYRMARLEVWTGRLGEGERRLERLRAALDSARLRAPATDPTPSGADTAAPPTRADVLSLLGDLRRWDGERLAAVERYEDALAEDPEHERAAEGLDALHEEVDRLLVEREEPGLGALTSAFGDTDDFRRYDAGGRWTGLHRTWVWSTRTGAQWLEGVELTGGDGSREGIFAELEGARWWRWGTIRTGAHLGLQTVRSGTVDVAVGASARLVGASGRRTDLRYDHEPAYPVTRTLQSVAADVRQDRLSISHSQPLSERWSAAVTAEAASLDHGALADADRNLRLQVGASVGRAVSPSVGVGLAARALRYRDAAPGGATAPLYWDPSLSLSVGPYLQLAQRLGTSWSLTARINPGLSWIDERGLDTELVPDLSGRLGVTLDQGRYQTSIEVSYGQGRFSGYRSLGVGLSFSAGGWTGPGSGS